MIAFRKKTQMAHQEMTAGDYKIKINYEKPCWVAGGRLLVLCITPLHSGLQCIHISEKKRRKIVHPVLKST